MNRKERRAIDGVEARNMRWLAERAAELVSQADEEELSLSLLEEDKQGARAKTRHMVRKGSKLAGNAKLSEVKSRAARYRAALSLCLTREEILEQTGWSLQELMATERFVREEDESDNASRDPGVVFGEYRERMLLCARELEDLGLIFRSSKQFGALVTSVKARADIHDKIVDRAQELGLVKRQARKVEVEGSISYDVMERREIELSIKNEIDAVSKIIDYPVTGSISGIGVAQKMLGRILPGLQTEPNKLPTANAAPSTVPARRKRLKKDLTEGRTPG